MQPLKILFLSSEVAPFAKTGGLADVCGSLPKALAAMGHEVRVVLPAYHPLEQAVHTGKHGIQATPIQLDVPVGRALRPAGVLESTLPGSSVPTYFIAEKHLFGDRPWIYGFKDDGYRFAFFSRAALELAVAAQNWRPDIVHAHDWHAAPAIFWLATAGRLDSRFANLPTVLTIHNLMHQGTVPWAICDYLGLVTYRLQEERYGEINFLARGIFHATMINTVSPNYAREIMTPADGFGLDGLLRHRHFDVHGILNGLDYEHFNPATDSALAATFDADSLERRTINKQALQERAGLPQRDDVPIVAMVTRLDSQKGLDITGHALHRLLNDHAGPAQCIILGSGDPAYEGMLRHLAGYHPTKMAAFLKYDAELAQLIYGGSDLFLMPSLFEPCGLGQLIAMRYGSVPVVRSVGGLMDTVRSSVTGFSFHNYSADDLFNTLAYAMHIWRHDRESWQAIQRKGMTSDFSWETSARSYQQLYEWAIARVRGW